MTHGGRLLLTMLPNEVNNEIGLGESPLVYTALHRTLEHALLLLLMLGLNVEIKGGSMKEALLTDVTLKGKFPLVLLHVIMHCALDPLRLSTMRTDEMAIGILLILGGLGGHFQ